MNFNELILTPEDGIEHIDSSLLDDYSSSTIDFYYSLDDKDSSILTFSQCEYLRKCMTLWYNNMKNKKLNESIKWSLMAIKYFIEDVEDNLFNESPESWIDTIYDIYILCMYQLRYNNTKNRYLIITGIIYKFIYDTQKTLLSLPHDTPGIKWLTTMHVKTLGMCECYFGNFSGAKIIYHELINSTDLVESIVILYYLIFEVIIGDLKSINEILNISTLTLELTKKFDLVNCDLEHIEFLQNYIKHRKYSELLIELVDIYIGPYESFDNSSSQYNVSISEAIGLLK